MNRKEKRKEGKRKMRKRLGEGMRKGGRSREEQASERRRKETIRKEGKTKCKKGKGREEKENIIKNLFPLLCFYDIFAFLVTVIP